MWLLSPLACAFSRGVDLPPEPVPAPPPPDPCEGLAAVDGFDFPVGKGEATDYYDAQPFLTNQHLGSDWNGKGGGNTDFGDPVSVIATGRVVFAEDVGGGWGQVVRVVHRDEDRCIESLYAHLSRVDVAVADVLKRGQALGAIGDAGGIYYAHLHLELRTEAGLDLGGGYGEPKGQVDPTAFIGARRRVDPSAQTE